MWDLLIGPVSKMLDDVIDKIVPDKNAAAKAKQDLEAQLQTAVLQAAQSQLDIDKTEAASPSIFVAGWRPFIGWICGIGLAWQYILMPLGSYAINIVATFNGTKIPPLPVLDNSTLMPLVMALLGLGGMRTYEKVQGVARDNLKVQPTSS
jgi:hypothetical protein